MYCEVWKENKISGRDQASLIEYLETITAGYPDPLAIYLPYVTDTKTNMLEPVLNKFLTFPAYSNDSRYVKLWILYADSLEKPDEVYNFLFTRGIGKTCSIMYVALAEVYESYQWYENAELVYLKGLISKAQPFDKLNEFYEKFLIKNYGKRSIGQNISIEEIRAISYLKKAIQSISFSPESYLEITPITNKAQSRISMSAYKSTPDLDKLYHSPNDNKVILQRPGLINGRLPLGLI
ncbi:hypothetical protein SteCoe_37035 [Stentor coeruleus]|uniref:BUB1 N-terminal domain-containing protein n=1 Tax=Stentor coeruleus TaxID=5963 RepID=A0A1R2ANT8_9CILI|nr:hypothetical protein SteCoe_37035 [Stentor coeruleus]